MGDIKFKKIEPIKEGKSRPAKRYYIGVGGLDDLRPSRTVKPTIRKVEATTISGTATLPKKAVIRTTSSRTVGVNHPPQPLRRGNNIPLPKVEEGVVPNLCIIHYNTPQLTEALVKSINKFVPKSNIYIFDNSDKNPFTYRTDNVTVFDNTKGQIINFVEWLKHYPATRNNPSKMNNFGSAKHCYSVEKCFDLINDNFILLDSDILLKKDITPLFSTNPEVAYVGSVEGQWRAFHSRIAPYLCFINVKLCKAKDKHFFNEEKMVGLRTRRRNRLEYDTGAFFYETMNGETFVDINYKEYIEHFGGGSWEISYNKANKTTARLTSQQWLNIKRGLWDMETYNERIILTMTTWKGRIGNIPHVLGCILKQTVLPDIININLSSTEFANKEGDIPEDVYNFIKKNSLIQINWVDGPNRKQWKKIIPTLAKYPKDIVICIDDDRTYPPTLIEELVNKHKELPNNPITVNYGYKINGMVQHCGHGTLDKLEYYGDMLERLDEEIYSYASSDTFFTYMANRAGHPIIPVNRTLNPKIKMYNEVNPLRKSQQTYGVESHKKMIALLDGKKKNWK